VSVFERLLANPWGPHDPEVAELARQLRSGPVAGKLVLVALGGGRCALARLPAVRPGAVERLGPEYASVIDGERDILRRRQAARA
jgi:hypothetical protein